MRLINQLGSGKVKNITNYITNIVSYSSRSSDSENTAAFKEFVCGKEQSVKNEAALKRGAQRETQAWREEAVRLNRKLHEL